LGVMEVQPVKGSMNRGECGQLGYTALS